MNLCWTSHLYLKNMRKSNLKGELCTAEICLLLLPEVVRFDDERHTDLGWEKLLQRLQQRLDQFPLGATHVDDDGETAFTYILADGETEQTGELEKITQGGRHW